MTNRIFQQIGLIRIGMVVILGAFLPGSVVTQVDTRAKLHTPSEIMKIMENSKLTYEIGGDFVAAPVDTPIVLSNQLYLRSDKNGSLLVMLSLSEEAQPVLDRAESAFHSGNFTEAIAQYKQVLVIQPDYVHALTLIGDAFYSLKQFDSAKTYFSRSIDLNFADYDAHWFLADTYDKLDNADGALREATIAHLLNVNHTNLQKAIRHYRARVNRPWKEWTFEPQFTLSRDANKVLIKTTPEWMGYALVKALWKYEPGYAASMLGERRDSSVIVWPEEKEAILSVLATNEKLKHVNDIIEKGFFVEFVFYEVAAKRHPMVLDLLPREEFMRVLEYVNSFH